jgi:hypothetical protein
MPISEDMAQVREDVAYIKAKIEQLPDHEVRIRALERWRWGIPGGLIAAVLAFFIS